MKKIPAIIMICLLFSLTLSSCKANEEIKDNLQKAKENLKESQDEMQKVEGEKEELQTNLNELTDEINSLESQVEVLSSELLAANELIDENESVPMSSTGYLNTALEVIEAIASNDFELVATYVHPALGVRFTPYPNIDMINDIVFTSTQMNTIATNTSLYLWGAYDGSGEPINLTFADYYDEFVYDEEFANFQILGNNTIAMTGNLIDNQLSAYPTANFVDFHFPGFDPQYSGMDWVTLRLVFEEISGVWYLVGVVHGQWTI